MRFTIVILLIALATGDGQFRYDYTYVPKLVGWLKLHVMPASFQEAFMMCNAEGAVLASPLNRNLKDVMMTLHTKIIGDYSALYTGINSFASKGSFVSVEGIFLSKLTMEWAPYEPDNFNNTENCIVMIRNGTMADVPCSETYPYICYKKKTVQMTLNECGTVDGEYTLDTRTGNCYKVHRIGRTWNRANMICLAEGGHLAVINSKTEAQVATDLMAKYPPESIFSPAPQHFSIGFYDWGESGVWFTIHGQPLSEAGYSIFAKGQPDNATTYDSSGSHCGGIFRTGLLDDVWCTGRNIPFICEKSPDSLMTTGFK